MDLSGGYNPDANEVLIADNEATDILNFRLDKLGSLVSRSGYSRFLVDSPGTIAALGRWRSPTSPNNNVPLVATEEGDLIGEVSGEWTQLATGLDAAHGEFVPARDIVVYANGEDLPTAYDGDNAYTLGITPPALPPSGSVASGGTLNGSYKYVYTYLDTTHGAESNPSPVMSISPSTQTVKVGVAASSESRVNAIRIYRTNAGGNTYLLWKQVANSDATHDDDGSVSLSTFALELDNDVPLKFEHMAYFRGYMFGSIENMLYWSKPFEPDAWPALNFTEVPFEGNDTITALWSYQDTLVIFGRNNIIVLAGSGGNWQLSRMDVDLGCVSDRAIEEIDGNLVFLSFDGVRVFPSMEVFAPKLNRTLAAYTPSELEAAALVYVPEERAVWIGMPDVTFTVHIPNQAISRYSIVTKQFLGGGPTGLDYPLFIDSAGKHVNQYGTVLTDLGQDITLVWRSKIFQMSNPELTKFIRRIGAFATTGSSSTVTITIADRNKSSTVMLSSVGGDNAALWNQFKWNEAVWASEGITYFIAALPADTLFGQTIQVTVSGTVRAATEITSPITFEYREANRFLGV